ncbi:MAG: alpha/beta hydrolase [Ignavibacteriae bacterium HGW-Ignavibacteriae-4]|jgi:haloalkane dehalogenase|nr:MAG: alpha/beta hydrolase [Ignavibacteriae bacterium HGW-Ignavibacteriae-4]
MKSNNSEKWLDKSEYPFESKFIDLKNGRMHYIDEGAGEIVLFVHGTPTWSFLYRNYIKELSKTNRCIAIDNLGFGLSENQIRFDGTPQSHSNNLIEFIEKMGLHDINLVVHDFGGPIGLSAAMTHHNRISKIIMFNTWLWETKSNKDVVKIDKVINSFIGKFMYMKLNFSAKVLLKKGFYNNELLTKKLHSQYIGPFLESSSRNSTYNLAKSLLGSSDWYEKQWQNLDKVSEKKWLILWGTKDSFLTTEYLKKWRTKLPNARVVELESGHFLQEEEFDKTLAEINLFLNN